VSRALGWLPALFAAFTVSAGTLPGALQRGDAAWSHRADGFFESRKLDPAPTERAIAAYEEALAEDPENFEIYFKLMDVLYFQGMYISTRRAEKKKLADRGVELTQHTLDMLVARAGGAEGRWERFPLEERVRRLSKVPHAVDVHFWAGINWGIWATVHGYLNAATKNVGVRIRDHARMVIRLDPHYWEGGGYRMLGRFHTDAPKVPLFTSWVDRREGIALLRKANAISTRDPRNPLFLAEGLLRFEPEHRQEALGLLRELAGRTPGVARPVEEAYYIEEARRVLKQVERRP